MIWKEELKQHTLEAEEIVKKYLPEEEGHQRYLIESSNYSVMVGGKRIRPIIMLESFRAFGGNDASVEPFMAALEMIHSSSLVHDDLPCMDNDEYRRGKLTTWKKYGYDMAVLAGDDLLVYAFETAAKAFALSDHPERVGRAIGVLANKAGIYGMIGGQSVDVQYTDQPVTLEQLEFIYRLKTGALLEAAMMIGAILAGADEEQIRSAEAIAADVGMAFQIRDDILDVVSTTEQLGKPVGSDEKNNKTTYVTLFGIDQAAEMVASYSARAIEQLQISCPDAGFLRRLFEYMIQREK